MEVILQISRLMLPETLEVFVSTLSADGKCPIQQWRNLQLPIQMQLSEKPTRFSQFFVPFLESK